MLAVPAADVQHRCWCSFILPQIARQRLKSMLSFATGALMSPTSTITGRDIPGIASPCLSFVHPKPKGGHLLTDGSVPFTRKPFWWEESSVPSVRCSSTIPNLLPARILVSICCSPWVIFRAESDCISRWSILPEQVPRYPWPDSVQLLPKESGKRSAAMGCLVPLLEDWPASAGGITVAIIAALLAGLLCKSSEKLKKNPVWVQALQTGFFINH